MPGVEYTCCKGAMYTYIVRFMIDNSTTNPTDATTVTIDPVTGETTTQPEVAPTDVAPVKAEPTEVVAGHEVLLNLESMIKSSVRTIELQKTELRKFKEMIESVLQNSETYRLHNENAKQAAKIKSTTKAEIMKLPQNAAVAGKAKELSQSIKEMEDGLSEYLSEYTRMSGTNEIEGEDGEVREIVYVPKLIKKSSYQAK